MGSKIKTSEISLDRSSRKRQDVKLSVDKSVNIENNKGTDTKDSGKIGEIEKWSLAFM